MMDIGLQKKTRTEACRMLNTLLADEFVLSTKTKNYHWNVIGPHFRELHALFGEQYRRLDDLIDRVAERIRALGGKPIGTLVGFLREARLVEHPAASSAWAMVDALQHDHEALIRDIREELARNSELMRDAGTTDFVTALLQEHETAAWMLRSLRGKEVQLEEWLNEQARVPYRKELPAELAASASGRG
ncbi:MAG: DNA starvation/stationary phase protection protein [Acidobacteria bacterium]|nr:DNA starvation/stationary phase protection protein [Acidobacteriota bacterium]MBS1864746.1 DNA starvation/stationary phase protection protein [Acidobacteriota bacterium]